ncbi:MAG: DUF2326 domain-containing protein [Candidatus Thiosymbion ectosymbiont of Robbea hypermnestra]|nr:DUF2326 domain-containing protein [Candidatus Thiosymbion ectosymbiont of Robbea hypermnestra]
MRLIELTADRPSFHPIRFRPEGISLIVGSRSRKGETDRDKTYNGVGKSLAIALIHFCLGSNRVKAFEESIPDWEFNLAFQNAGGIHRALRNTSRQDIVIFDGQEMKVTEFREQLAKLTFDLPAGIEGLSFRGLLYKFLRRDKKDYVEAEYTSGDHSPYQKLIRNIFLLGFDMELVTEKARLYQRLKRIQESNKSLKDDPVLREFYTANKDVDIELSFLQERITKLEKSQRSFEVAEDYYQVEKEANDLGIELQTLKNRAVILENAIKNIGKSLEVRPDITPGRIEAAYRELESAFRPETLRRLDEVQAFHRHLVSNRVTRLTQERRRLEHELIAKERSIRELNEALNEKTAFLGRSRALDYFVAIGNEIANLKAKAQKLQDYRALDRRWSDELATTKTALQQEVLRTNQYLARIHPRLEEINDIFKGLSRRLYPDSPAGLTLHNNDRGNQVRFDFKVRIENDASDGINEARIFCYDLTLLTAGHNHHVDFVVHDSRLFSDMDPRQRVEIFRIAQGITKHRGCQYIATLNEDQIQGIEGYLTVEERQGMITDNIVLTLGDRAPSEKLLGVQVDMHY